MSRGRRGQILFLPGTRRARLEETHGSMARRDRYSSIIVGASVIGALALYWAGATLSQHDENAGIGSLPTAARQGLYARTLDELSTICRDPVAAGGNLHDHCVAQARFVLDFPECGDACQRSAAAVMPHARR